METFCRSRGTRIPVEVVVGSAGGQGAVRRGQGRGESWGAQLSGGGLDVGGEDGRVGFHHRAGGGGGVGDPEEMFGQGGALLGAEAAPPARLGGGGGAGPSRRRVVGLRRSTQAVLQGLSTGG